MPNYAYVDKKYCNKIFAKTFIDDRGYQFGDSVYEVIIYRNGVFLDLMGHIKRLRNSIKRLDFKLRMSNKSLFIIIKYLVKINKINFGSIYIQISRGISERDHSYHNMKLNPVLIITTKKFKNDFEDLIKGINVILVKDTRWSHPDIKTVQLLPNVLAKTYAKNQLADEAIFVDKNDFITEGSSSNVWILTHGNILITRSLDGSILPGITRNTIFECAKKNKLSVKEKKFKVKELINAKEVFITSASSFVTPVNKVDNSIINNGSEKTFSNQLRKTYLNLYK